METVRSIKVERWYDIKCDFCGRHLSSDFGVGMLRDREETIRIAKAEGFKKDKFRKMVLCPICVNEKRGV